ncbi:MAG: biotin carboxylase N-terminal domain-containing protein, partial [Xanthobacteraceae bacterium]|nr:biotin carboxylase N-terminal domain-containing protein [Xanthobacteraceae bacterium]
MAPAGKSAAPFESVLIANRGEIAVRVIRTARALGLRTIAVFSEADRQALHVRLADEAHFIGPAPARDSYLDVMRLIEVARRTRAASLHPGYGFLSERAELAEACAAAGIVFIGPPPAAIRMMGDKAAAKTLMEMAGVPVVPGYHGERQEPKFLRQKAYEFGYPVAIKAAAGGGGKGMRKIDKAIEFDAALGAARREAEAAFGDKRVLVEKWIADPRHIEVQIVADRHGNIVHLYERDCSAQRRQQKVIEEAPAPGLDEATRAAITSAAIEGARTTGYVGAGTVEFLAEAGPRPGRFWFLEMNARLQVEHPVTEAVTGLDLVEWQFRVAAGEKLPLAQEEIVLAGHAVEARFYAEEPEKGFLPSTGRIVALKFPAGEGIRIDSGVEEGAEVTSHYDPLLAKVIAHAPTRAQALDRLASALSETVIAGPRSNLAFLRALLDTKEMRAGKLDTGFIERNLTTLAAARPPDLAAVAAAVERLLTREQARLAKRAARRSDERRSPWDAADAFDLAGGRAAELHIRIDGENAAAQVRYGPDGPHASIGGTVAAACLLVEVGDAVIAVRDGRQISVRLADSEAAEHEPLAGGGVVLAPMHGRVLAVEVKEGDRVKRGQRIA